REAGQRRREAWEATPGEVVKSYHAILCVSCPRAKPARMAFSASTAVDTQSVLPFGVLPFGTPDQVRVETQLRIDQLNQSGGYVLCSAHNIRSDVPAENVIAMYETALGRRLVEVENPRELHW
ncbi:MAG: hypothetical protein ACM3S0_19900, partial [Acidobacteriota bacterium]